MNSHAGRTTSIWMETATRPEFPSLTSNQTADVCVIGAGIAGLSTAYHLTRAGSSVIVLDDGPIVSGETERTTAHLASALDDRFVELERIHGEEGARLAAVSHAAAIDLIEQTVRDEAIDCDFARVDGYLFNAPDQPADLLERELAAAHRAGLLDVRLVDRAPLASFNTGPALWFPRQAQFHPLKYLARMAEVITRSGSRIFTQSHASTIQGGPAAFVETSAGRRVSCSAIVVATNTPVNDRVVIHTKQGPYRTYVIGLKIPAGSVPRVLYWDTADPYHYVRLQASADHPRHDVLIVGGEDHKTGQADDTEERFSRLEAWSRARFPMAGELLYHWSGQVMEPVDSLAFIGRNPMDHENVYIATGDSGNGMTHGTIAGRLLTDLIHQRENPWAGLYDPSRVTLKTATSYAGENANMAAQYLDWVTAGDHARREAIPVGGGAIVRSGLAKLAIYRDELGEFHACSAVCPHLHGIVTWNHEERTWDCPVHGSRFDCHGKVLNGPANSDLTPIEQPLPSRISER